MTEDQGQCTKIVDALKQAISLKCDNTKEMMSKSTASNRASMRQLRVLAQDITEMVMEKLDVNDAKRILYELLQDFGWEEGQAIQQNMTMSLFDQSMIDQTMVAGSLPPSMGKTQSSHSDNLLKNDFLAEMGV